MKNVFLFLLSLLFFATVMSGCKREPMEDKPAATQNSATTKANSVQRSLKGQLVKDLAPATGSTVGPDGYLYVPDPPAGSILRIHSKTGDYTTYASGLPQLIPTVDPNIGGITDVAFLNGKLYALVSAVDDPLFPTGQVNGIYRIDGANSFKVIADIGAFNIANPPTGIEFELATGVLYAIQPYQGGFLVTDGHLNRVLYVTLDGNISVVKSFGDVVPTGLASKGSQVFMSEAGPVPHLPKDGKVISFNSRLPKVIQIAAGAPLLVDVEFGNGLALFALSQGLYSGGVPGTPALPNTGALVKVNAHGTFNVVADELNQPTSLEIIGNTAYIITLAGEIWTVDNITGPPYDRPHPKHFLYSRH